MLHLLKRHPLPMQAFFRDVLVLTYAAPAERVAPLVPPGLTMETHEGSALLAVAMVQAERMRPAGAPEWLGRRFFLAGVRTFVRFREWSPDGPLTRRGLRILRSFADRRTMVFFGNLLTHYHYRPCAGNILRTDGAVRAELDAGDAGSLQATAMLSADNPALPEGSVFDDWRQARRFAGPMPLTFDYEAQTHSIVAIRGSRGHWQPRPVSVHVGANTLLSPLGISASEARLSSAFHVADVPYRWERGVVHRLSEGGKP